MQVLAVGGPYNEQVLKLAHGSTFTFEAKGMKGSYLLSKELCAIKVAVCGKLPVVIRNKTIWKESK